MGLDYEIKAIRETPPTAAELKAALRCYNGELRRLFNTSGNDYRELGLKHQLPTMTEDEAISLLAANGNLVKRPFLIDGEIILTGFKSEVWENHLA